ncbi:MAG: hypothetical protein H7315_05360 [Herminiimonas sp.]|nr:hypothetical protein [Herminiimonas sp.]
MRLSYFFEDLTKAYHAELDDLQSDSEGKNVLHARLKEKRTQFAALMPMIEVAPEMVAVVFHGQISFVNLQVMAQLAASEPDDFPSWDEVKTTISFQPGAEKLAAIALKESGGEQFLITTACLEYLYGKSDGRHESASVDDDDAEGEDGDEQSSGGRRGRSDDEGEDMESDLDEAGADWLADQGFDRKA